MWRESHVYVERERDRKREGEREREEEREKERETLCMLGILLKHYSFIPSTTMIRFVLLATLLVFPTALCKQVTLLVVAELNRDNTGPPYSYLTVVKDVSKQGLVIGRVCYFKLERKACF